MQRRDSYEGPSEGSYHSSQASNEAEAPIDTFRQGSIINASDIELEEEEAVP